MLDADTHRAGLELRLISSPGRLEATESAQRAGRCGRNAPSCLVSWRITLAVIRLERDLD
jgi:hypothetical protein